MPQEKSEAVVVRGVDFSESSRIVTFLTPRHGRMACIAKGVRRKNSRFAGALDTFNHVELVFHWKEGREVQTLAEASLLHAFPGVKRDIEKSACAAYPLEFAWKCAPENAPSEGLCGALLCGLYGLEHWGGTPLWHTCWQVMGLLDAVGLAPELDACIRSGRAASGAVGFSWEGGVCVAGAADARLGETALAKLREMRAAREQCPVSGFDVDAEARLAREIFGILRGYATHQLETEFRSVRVMAQVLGF